MTERRRDYGERVDHAPAEQHDAFFDAPIDGLTEAERRERPSPDADRGESVGGGR